MQEKIHQNVHIIVGFLKMFSTTRQKNILTVVSAIQKVMINFRRLKNIYSDDPFLKKTENLILFISQLTWYLLSHLQNKLLLHLEYSNSKRGPHSFLHPTTYGSKRNINAPQSQ
jgi:hypothetical protein